MVGQRDSDDGMKKPRLIKISITRGKVGMVSFLHKLKTWETMLEDT